MTDLRGVPGGAAARAYRAVGLLCLVTFGPSVVNPVLVADEALKASGGVAGTAVLAQVAQLLGWDVATIALAVLIGCARGVDAAALGLCPARTARA